MTHKVSNRGGNGGKKAGFAMEIRLGFLQGVYDGKGGVELST